MIDNTKTNEPLINCIENVNDIPKIFSQRFETYVYKEDWIKEVRFLFHRSASVQELFGYTKKIEFLNILKELNDKHHSDMELCDLQLSLYIDLSNATKDRIFPDNLLDFIRLEVVAPFYDEKVIYKVLYSFKNTKLIQLFIEYIINYVDSALLEDEPPEALLLAISYEIIDQFESLYQQNFDNIYKEKNFKSIAINDLKEYLISSLTWFQLLYLNANCKALNIHIKKQNEATNFCIFDVEHVS